MFKEIIIDGLVIHSNTGFRDMWIDIDIEGFDASDMRETIYDRPGENGSRIPSMFYGRRPISLPGTVQGANPTVYEANRQLIMAAIRQKYNAFGIPIPKRVTVTTLAGAQYFVDVVFGKPMFGLKNIKWDKFLLQGTSADSFIYGANLQTSGVFGVAQNGGFVTPVATPIVSSPSTGGSGSLNNPGLAPTPPLIVLTGPLTKPVVYNQALGLEFVLNYNIPSGSIVIIDMQAKNILMDNTTPLISYKGKSRWYYLDPGITNFTFSTDNNADTGTVEIKAYPAYTGI